MTEEFVGGGGAAAPAGTNNLHQLPRPKDLFFCHWSPHSHLCSDALFSGRAVMGSETSMQSQAKEQIKQGLGVMARLQLVQRAVRTGEGSLTPRQDT